MNRYDKTPAFAYRKLSEMSIEPEAEVPEDGSEYEGLDMDGMKTMFLDDLTEEIIEILREMATEDRSSFESNKEDLFRSIEGLLRQPTLRDVSAQTLVRRESVDVA